MGAVLEMKIRLLIALMAVSLAACGNEPANKDMTGVPAAFLSGAKNRVAPANTPNLQSAAPSLLRDSLEKAGQPIILASNASLKYSNLLTPFGGSNGVRTWSSTSYQTISLRDGVMVATRGFGPDLMSSVLPTIATIAAANGITQRRYSYLDGADQPQSLDFACNLAAAGTESIDVMAKTFATRKVTEVCSGTAGIFTNEYWFDGSTNLRQSKQFLAPGLANMLIQGVID